MLAGFLLIPAKSHRSVHIAVLPFIALSFVLVFLVFRLSDPERDDKTGMFYANLPRSRALTYWTHAAWLSFVVLVYEGVIMLGVALRLNVMRSDLPVLVAPYMFVLPFFAMALMMWFIYGVRRWFVDLPVVLLAIFALGWLVIWDIELRDGPNEYTTVTVMQNIGPALVLAAVSALLLWHGCRFWQKTQVGELS